MTIAAETQLCKDVDQIRLWLERPLKHDESDE
jgi:hypothetical protein